MKRRLVLKKSQVVYHRNFQLDRYSNVQDDCRSLYITVWDSSFLGFKSNDSWILNFGIYRCSTLDTSTQGLNSLHFEVTDGEIVGAKLSTLLVFSKSVMVNFRLGFALLKASNSDPKTLSSSC